jgi:DEAD/DEAH box helicase domain-containing protein
MGLGVVSGCSDGSVVAEPSPATTEPPTPLHTTLAQPPFPAETAGVLTFLEEEGTVRHTNKRWYWANRSFPAEGISLRSAGADNVVIVDITKGRNNVIGEMDRPSAKEMLFQNAVYIHRGSQYMVESLDIENRKALVRESEVNYFTDGLVKTDIKVLSQDDYVDAGVVGDVLIRSQVTRFKKLKFHTHENLGYGDITLPEEEYQTRALILLFRPDSPAGTYLDSLDPAAASTCLSGVGTLIRNIAPVYLLCDSRDLGIAERVCDPHFGMSALYIYDKYPGGTGLAEALSGITPTLFNAVLSALEACPCAKGCPSCVGPGGNKAGAAELVRRLIG